MHTKVEVRVAHLLGMYSFDDFRIGPWALRWPSNPGEGCALRDLAHRSIILRFRTGEFDLQGWALGPYGPSTPGEEWALKRPAHQGISLGFHTGAFDL